MEIVAASVVGAPAAMGHVGEPVALGMRETSMAAMEQLGELAPMGTRDPAPAGALPGAQRGSSWNVGRQAIMETLPFVHHSTLVLHFYGFLHKHSWFQISSLLSPQAVYSQPTVILSLGLLSKPHVPAPSPCQHWWTPVSGCGMQGCGTDHL